jgi:hypothetical protein
VRPLNAKLAIGRSWELENLAGCVRQFDRASRSVCDWSLSEIVTSLRPKIRRESVRGIHPIQLREQP